jgi:mono/diheme cytochrome c family protein
MGIALGLLVLTAASVGPAILSAQGSASAVGRDGKRTKNPVPSTPESIAGGRRVYVRLCASCHGPTGKGDGGEVLSGVQPSNLVDNKWDHGSSDGEIFAVIRDGIPPDLAMEPWEGRISETDMWNVINYIRSLGARPSGAAAGPKTPPHEH